MLKKIMSWMMIFTVVFTPTLASAAANNEQENVATSEQNANENKNYSSETTELSRASINEDVPDAVLEVAPYVHKDDQGFLYVDKNIPQDIYIQNEVQLLEKSFEEINRKVANGKALVNDDLSITDTTFTLNSKGYTSETFWRGVRATYTNQQAKDAISQLRSASQDVTLITAALVWIPSMAGVTGLTAAYLGKLAQDMESKNNGKGVILDMTWALIYTVKSR